MLHSALLARPSVQYSTVQHSTVHENVVQHSTVQHSKLQYSTAWYLSDEDGEAVVADAHTDAVSLGHPSFTGDRRTRTGAGSRSSEALGLRWEGQGGVGEAQKDVREGLLPKGVLGVV